MSAPLNRAPRENTAGQMVFGTHRSRLAVAMRNTRSPEEIAEYDFAESEDALAKDRPGVANPYGSGIDAFEPNTILFDQYRDAYDAMEQDKAREKALAEESVNVPFGAGPGTDPMPADGQVGKMIQAALDLAARRVPYVWGGTTANGVDCSGLIYYAMRSAGINVPRYRAIDWGQQGAAVTADQARPGDLVYWNNPGTTTDHVGIYLGNGKVVQAPTTGDVVKVSQVWNNPPAQYRRIFTDDQFQRVSTPAGHTFWGYGEQGRTWSSTPVSTPRPPTTYGTPTPNGVIRRTWGGMTGLQE